MAIYITLISAMLLGRVIWGLVRFIISQIDKTIPLSLNIFITSSFITAWPGILIQLLIIPPLIYALKNKNKKEA